MTSKWIGVPLVVGLIHFFVVGCGASQEHSVVTKLLTDYTASNVKIARPLKDFNDTINIHFGAALVKADVNTVTNRLTASIWLRYYWPDEYLKWDPTSYDGVKEVRIPANKLWTPDIVLFNGFGRMEVNVESLCVIYSEGNVLWIPTATVQVDCTQEDDVYYCPMKFGSWTYNGNMVNLEFYEGKDSIDTYDYFVSNTFELVNTTAIKTSISYPCCPGIPYEDVTYHLKLKDGSTSGASGTSSVLYLTLVLTVIVKLL